MSILDGMMDKRIKDAAHDLYWACIEVMEALEDEYPIEDKDDEFIRDTLGHAVSSAYFAARDAVGGTMVPVDGTLTRLTHAPHKDGR